MRASTPAAAFQPPLAGCPLGENRSNSDGEGIGSGLL